MTYLKADRDKYPKGFIYTEEYRWISETQSATLTRARREQACNHQNHLYRLNSSHETQPHWSNKPIIIQEPKQRPAILKTLISSKSRTFVSRWMSGTRGHIYCNAIAVQFLTIDLSLGLDMVNRGTINMYYTFDQFSP